jgi:L-threonylcarbamoyladenylate synthase
MYQQSLKTAAGVLYAGGVIGYPTEGVFGLGCDPFNADAVGRILAIKKRPVEKGLIVIADSIERLTPYLQELTVEHISLLQNHWPGPYTFVIPHNGKLPGWVTGDRDTVAVRVSNHPTARAICKEFGRPIVSTSANYSGRPSLITALQTQAVLGDQLDYLVKGRVQTPGKASQIIDLLSGAQFRA